MGIIISTDHNTHVKNHGFVNATNICLLQCQCKVETNISGLYEYSGENEFLLNIKCLLKIPYVYSSLKVYILNETQTEMIDATLKKSETDLAKAY